MTILFSGIIERDDLLACFPEEFADAHDACEMVLTKRKDVTAGIVEYRVGKYDYYIMVDSYLCIFCVTKNMHREQATIFLKEVFDRTRYINLQDQYSKPTLQWILQNQIETVNTDQTGTQKIRGEIDHVKKIVCDNIQSIIERGEKLDTLQSTTYILHEESGAFAHDTIQLRSRMYKNKIIAVISVIIIILVIVAVLYGLLK